MSWDDPKIIAAVISVFVSIVTVIFSFLFKTFFERHFHIFKLEAEHEYEQKKKIKEIIAKYKTHLLDAAESLNHRLWNFADNYDKDWHTSNDLRQLAKHYYLSSFVYRVLEFFSWARRVELEMVYLDSTIASKSDLSFIKFIKLFPQMMCDVALFNGLDYDDEFPKDHFFKNDFVNFCEYMFINDGVASFTQYLNNEDRILEKSISVADFISGMNPNENRLRWDRLQAFHYVLMIFLNIYGYDFQYTNRNKIREVRDRARKNKTLDNIEMLLQRFQLTKGKEVKRVTRALQRL